MPPAPSGKEWSRSVTPEDAARLGELLLGQRLIALGVVVDSAPVVGLLPYAVSEDRRALYVQASSLARHSRGLAAGAPWSGLIHEPDGPETDPLRVPRLQLEGVVEPLSGQHPEFDARIPETVSAGGRDAPVGGLWPVPPRAAGRKDGPRLRAGPQPVAGALPGYPKRLRWPYNPEPMIVRPRIRPVSGERGH